jgi:hypothetical protein
MAYRGGTGQRPQVLQDARMSFSSATVDVVAGDVSSSRTRSRRASRQAFFFSFTGRGGRGAHCSAVGGGSVVLPGVSMAPSSLSEDERNPNGIGYCRAYHGAVPLADGPAGGERANALQPVVQQSGANPAVMFSSPHEAALYAFVRPGHHSQAATDAGVPDRFLKEIAVRHARLQLPASRSAT